MMKKILFGLIVCAILFAMTGVVSACTPAYCKVTGGGIVADEICEIKYTVTFNAKGTCSLYPNAEICNSKDGVQGKVTIVNHNTKDKYDLAVVSIEYFGGGGGVMLLLDNNHELTVYDHGEGKGSADRVDYNLKGAGAYTFTGDLSGNAQVRITEAT